MSECYYDFSEVKKAAKEEGMDFFRDESRIKQKKLGGAFWWFVTRTTAEAILMMPQEIGLAKQRTVKQPCMSGMQVVM